MTPLSHTVLRGLSVHAALGVLVCALMLCLLAANGLTAASAAPTIVSVTVMEQAQAPDAEREAVPALHADGAMLDIDDPSGEGRSSASAAAAVAIPSASLGLPHANDDRAAGIGVPLPERPPRA